MVPEGENTFTAHLVCELKKIKHHKTKENKKNEKKKSPTPPPKQETLKNPNPKPKGGRGGICFSVHTTCPVNQHRNTNYILKSGLSCFFSDI